MADNSAKIANIANILSVVHITVGFFLFICGIVDVTDEYSLTGYVGFGIWIGAWMIITGGLGVPGTRKERTPSRNCLAGVFMGFSITSAVFGGIIIICYGISIAVYRYDYSYNDYRYGYRSSRYDAEMTISALILILGIVEFVIGIWVAVCLCMMKPTCCNSNPPQQGQVMQTGYVMTQGPDGVPVAVPMQAGGGMVVVQAVQAVTQGAQEGQSQNVIVVPVSGEMATGYQPEQVEMPQSYGHRGQYMKLVNKPE